MLKRTTVVQSIANIISAFSTYESNKAASHVLAYIEEIMEPKVRPLTEKEVEDHELVKQVHHSRKDEVKEYVRGLDYEWKRAWIEEDDN